MTSLGASIRHSWSRRWRSHARRWLANAQPIRLVSVGRADQTWEQGREDWRAYELPLPEALVGLARISNGTFYDVGANCGYYSALLGRLGVVPRIVCFEPLPDILPRLRANLWVNDVDAHVAEVALSDSVGTATLHLPPDGHGLVETSASLNASFKPEIARTLVVRTITADAFNAARNNERVGLVKLDVEGADHLVLEGAHGLVARDRPLMTIELLHKSRLDVVAAFLARHDYVLIPLHPDGPGKATRQPIFELTAHNQALVPKERAEEAIAAISDHEGIAACVATKGRHGRKLADRRAAAAERAGAHGTAFTSAEALSLLRS